MASKYCFVPVYGEGTAPKEIFAYLETQVPADAGSARTHPVLKKGVRHLASKARSQQIKMENIDGKLHLFVDGGSLNEAEATVMRQMQKYREGDLNTVADYEINILGPGARQVVDVNNKDIQLFCVTDKANSSSYFDLVLFVPSGESRSRNWLSLNYSNRLRNGQGLAHSGDIGSLLHYVVVDDNLKMDEEVVVSVVGFRRTPLKNFRKQVPCILLVDSAARILHLIPCPLDVRTMGSNTMASLCGFRRISTTELEFYVLPSPKGLAKKDTTSMDAEVSSLASGVAAEINKVLNKPVSRPETKVGGYGSILARFLSSPTPVEQEQEPEQEQEEEEEEDLKRGLFLLADADTVGSFVLPQDESEVVVSTGLRLVQLQQQKDLASLTTDDSFLPIGFSSVLEGAPALALGLPAVNLNLTPKAFQRVVESSRLLVAHISSPIFERLIKTTVFKANALFVLHVPRVDETNVEECLNELNITGYTSRRGPMATLIVQCDESNRRFFYSCGARIPGLIDVVPEFGEDVSLLLSDENIYNNQLCSPFPSICSRASLAVSPVEARLVWFHGKMTSLKNVIDVIPTLSIENLKDQSDDDYQEVLCVLVQLQSILEPSELRPVRQQFTAALNQLVKESTVELVAARQQFAKELHDAFVAKPDQVQELTKQHRKLVEVVKAKTREGKRVVQKLVDFCVRLVSTSRSSSRKLDLARVQKLDKLVTLRKEIYKMDWETLSDALCGVCSDFVFCGVDSAINQQMLSLVAKEKMISMTLASDDLPNLMAFEARLTGMIDAYSAIALAEVTSDTQHRHPFSCKNAIAIPGFASDGSLIGFPLLDEDIALSDCGDVFWVGSAEGEGGANTMSRTLARQIFRRLFINSIAGKDAGMPKHAESVELTFYIAHVILCTIKRLTQHLPEPTAEKHEREDSVRRTLRGLYGLLLSFLASGVDPASNIWCLVQKNAKMTLPKAGKGEWGLTVRFIQDFKHTCWPTRILTTNTKLLVVNAVRAIADTLLAPMRAALEETTRLEAAQHCASRNRELKISYAIVKFIRKTFGRQQPPTKALVRKLLEAVCTSSLKPSTKEDGIRCLIRNLQNYTGDGTGCFTPKSFEFVVKTADSIFNKRHTRNEAHHRIVWHVPPTNVQNGESCTPSWVYKYDGIVENVLDGTTPSQVKDGVVKSTKRKSPLLSAIEGKAGCNAGALQVARMLDNGEPISIVDIFNGLCASANSAKLNALHPESIPKLLSLVGYPTDSEQSRVVGNILTTFLTNWRGNSEQTLKKALATF